MKQIATIHYNTPELTEAMILSLRKVGMDWPVTILDNSDKRPFKKKMDGVKVINNRKGKIIDLDAELEKFENKNPNHSECNRWGSVRHIMSVQKLWELLPDGFLLVESDVLVRKNLEFMCVDSECTVGHVQWHQPGNLYDIPRLVPMICWINVPLCVAGGARYYDPERCWMLYHEEEDKRNWYDTGASFLEDIRTLKPQCHGKAIDIRPLMLHYQKGSWERNDLADQKEWLERNANLWR
jgi:hypothetical protein